MKELSIEEKALAYDEIVARAKKYLEDCPDRVDARGCIEHLIPELAESEDERIRKALIKLVKKAGEGYENVIDGVSIENAISWLEKQGEQKPADKDKPKFKVGDKITKNSGKSCPVHSSTDDTICEVAEVHDTCYILNTKEGRIQEPFKWQDYYELVEQNPAWSEEDETVLNNLIYALANDRIGNNREEYVVWLKSLRDKAQPQSQPKQEWSEEDRKHFEGCLQYFATIKEDSIFYKDYLWLKQKFYGMS